MFSILNLITVFNVRKKSQRLNRVILIYLKYTDGINFFLNIKLSSTSFLCGILNESSAC